MPISLGNAQPASPALTMCHNFRAMHLRGAGEPRRAGLSRQRDEGIPSRKNIGRWLARSGAERASRSRRRESAEAPLVEIGDAEVRQQRQSSMRVILAPSALRRSSMRS